MEQSLDGIDSGMFADALDSLKVDGSMTGLIPLSPGQRFSGPAVTVRMLLGTPGTFDPDEIGLGFILEEATAGSVIIIDVGGSPTTVWGELTTIAAQNKGINGVVVDGAVRDADIIRAARFPIMTRHITPRAGKTRLRLGSVNKEPVLCGGVTVFPGDFVFADETGVIVIPNTLVSRVMKEVEAIKTRELALKSHMEKGLSYLEAARMMGRKQL